MNIHNSIYRFLHDVNQVQHKRERRTHITKNINKTNKKAEHKLPYRLVNDYLFRALLQKNETALRCLLACLLEIPVEEIIMVEIRNPIILGEAIDDKTCILDLYIMLNRNRKINIEMQVANQGDWIERSVYYLCKAYCNLKKGQTYIDALPTLHIGILNFNLFPDESPELYSEILLMNKSTHKVYSSKFGIRVLDLTQVDESKALKDYPELCYWAKFFIADTWEEVEELSQKSDGIKQAVVTLKELTADEKIRLQCEAREMYEMKQQAVIRCGEARGEARGIKIGESRGIEIGESRGIEIGENKVNRLNQCLIKDNRFEDLQKAAADKEFQNLLMAEYRLQ